MDLAAVHLVVVAHPEGGDILTMRYFYFTLKSDLLYFFMHIVQLMTGMILEVIMYGAIIIVFSFSAWMCVDAAKQDRFWWIVIILGVPIIGPAVYYFTEKKHDYAKAKSHHIHDSETEAQHETSHEHHEHHRKEDIEPAIILATVSHENKKGVKGEEKENLIKEVEVKEIV